MIERVRARISLLLDDNKSFTDTDPLVSSGRLNSLKIIELASWIETNYSVDFSKKAFNVYDFENVLTIVNFINENS
jgi:acyl carrier protein